MTTTPPTARLVDGPARCAHCDGHGWHLCRDWTCVYCRGTGRATCNCPPDRR